MNKSTTRNGQLKNQIRVLQDRVTELEKSELRLKRAEEELIKAGQLNEAMLQTIPFGMDIVDMEGNILFTNERLAKMFGENAVGRKCWELIKDDKQPCKNCPLRKGICMGETESVEAEGCFGGRIIRITHTAMVYLGKTAILEIFQDITERVKIEREFEKTNEFLRQVLESLSHPFYVIDARDYSVKLANTAANLGRLNRTSTCYALTHYRQTPCSKGDVCPLEIMRETKEPVTVEHRYYDQNGSLKHVEVHAYPILDESGELAQMIEYSLDITDRKEAEEKLRRANKELEQISQLKSQFVATVSHESYNPLGIVRESLELLLDGYGGELSEKQREVLDIGKKAINRLIRLVSDLLDLSKIESGKVDLNRDHVDIKELLEELLKNYERELSKKRLTVRREVPDDIGLLWADRDKLSEVIINLLTNAIKYSPEESVIGLRLKGENNEIRCEISDSGPGIPKDCSEKIFDKYERIKAEKQEGTGLGLSIAKEIIGLHQGRIWLESEPGRGSTFIFVLPRDLRKE